MRMRLVFLILVAFGAAIGTVIFARNWMEAQRAAMTQAPPPPPSAKNEILVAKEDLPAGTLLKAEQLRWQAWPDSSLAPTYPTIFQPSAWRLVPWKRARPISRARAAAPSVIR